MRGAWLWHPWRMSDAPLHATTRAELMARVWAEPLGVVAAEVGLSANGLAKLCDRLIVPRPHRRYRTLAPAQRAAVRPVLPAAPPGVEERIVIGEAPRPRRERTRLPVEERREQLMDCAAAIVAAAGAGEVTVKRVAQDAGISEAQAHNCFSRRIDLLIALARRELAGVEASRATGAARGEDRITRIVLSTIAYLHEARERGPVLQELLGVPEVREALRQERAQLRDTIRAPVLDAIVDRYGVSRARAVGTNGVLTAVSLRAGALLANRRTDLLTAERICIAMLVAGSRSNAEGRERP